jgi:hypothetical protein
MATCTECGAVLEAEEARFCSQCGKPAQPRPAPADSAAPTSAGPTGPCPEAADHLEEAETIAPDGAALRTRYAQAVAEAMADGVLDAHDRQVLDDTRRLLRLTEGEAAGLEEETIHRLTAEPSPADGPDLPIRLEINANRFYMEKHAGVLDFRLRNPSGKAVRNARLSVSGNFLGASPESKVGLPAGGRACRCGLQILPSTSGEHLIRVVLSCEIDGEPAVFAADRIQPVLQQDTTPASLTVVIDQRMQAGRNIGYGMNVRNEVKEGIAKGIIRTANDLLAQRFRDDWSVIPLACDEEMTRALAERPDAPVRVAGMANGPPAPVDRLSLLVGAPPGASRVLLLGSAQVRFGRGRNGNDVVLRVLPRSDVHDMRSRQIGAQHLVLSLCPEGLVVADHDTFNGTSVDGRPVKGRVVLPADKPFEIDVGKALRLRVVPFLDCDDEAAGHLRRYEPLGQCDDLWRAAQGLRIRSLLIERVDNLVAEEHYLVVYRWACVGRGAGSEVLLPSGCHERRCMRILRLGGRFWLEGLADNPCLSVGGVPIGRNTVCPLAPEVAVGCSDTGFSVGPFAQHGL